MDSFTGLFDTSDFPARWKCGLWTPAHGWLHILSDLGVWSAYFAIPLVLGFFAARRKDLPFRRVFLLFVAFILLCGTTHLMEAVIFWWPAYRLAGVLKLFTAVISWVTVFALIRVAPTVLAMRSPEELEREVTARTFAEQRLTEANTELERRVEDRTAELGQSVVALQQERELLRTTLMSIGDGVVTTDRDGNVTGLNGVAEILTGWTIGDAAGVPLSQVFHIVNEESRQPVENPALRALEEGSIVGLANHTLLISKDGIERPIEDSASPIRSATGEVVGCVLVFRDISEKKQLEDARQAAQHRVVETLESVTDGFMRFDNEWRIVYVNAEAERINQLTRSQMLGGIFWEVLPAVVGTKLEAEFRRAVTDQVTVEFENYDERFGRWFVLKGYPTAEGGLTTFIRDISEQKVHQEALAVSEARLRRVFESNVVGMIRWDLDRSLILDANSEFLRMTGYTREDVAAGRLNFRDMTPPEWTPRNETGIRAIRAEGQAAPYEKEYFRKDGSRLPLIIAGTRFEDSNSEGMSLIIDISDRKRAEQEIIRLASESERQRRLYETVLTNTPDFVYVFSLDHKVLYANDALIRMWGRGQEAIGKTFLEIGYETWHAEMHDREIDQVRATKQPIRGEVPFHGTNGQRDYEYIFVPVLGAYGEVEAVAGTTRDVTDRKEAEAERERLYQQVEGERGRLTDVFRQAPAFMCVLCGPEHIFEMANDRYYQLVGHRVLIGKTIRQAFPEIEEQGFIELLDEVYQTGQSYVGTSMKLLLATQPGLPPDERYVDFVYQTLRDPHGKINGILVVGVDVTDRQQAELRVRASEERFRSLVTATTQIVWASDPNGVIVEDSPTWRAFTGNTFEEWVGTGWLNAIHPDDREKTTATWQQAVQTTTIVNATYRLRRHDGEYRTMMVRVVPVTDGSGAVREWVGTNTDITDRWQAEERLRESEERAAFVRRSSGVGFWYCDLPFDVLQWDELVKAHFHLPPDATVTISTFYELIHPDDREPTRLAIERSIANRMHYDTHYRTVNPDTGAVKCIRAIGRTFYSDDGTPTRFDGVTLDVSEQKRIEASLKENEERYRSVIEQVQEHAIFGTDTEGRATTWNEGVRRVLGFEEADFVGQDIVDIIFTPEDVRTGVPQRELDTAAAVGSASNDRWMIRKDSKQFWAAGITTARRDESGRLLGFTKVMRDMTAQKTMENELRQLANNLSDADRKKDEFLATLAHELRNPLAPIRNGLQVIRMAGATGTVEQARSMMERQLGQMVRLVDDLLDVSRVTTGKLTLSTDRIELRAVIEGALETTRPIVEHANHKLTVTVPNKPIFVNGDLTRLAQVVSNLLTNSAKYTHRGGHIQLSVALDGESAVISVADDGIGIPPTMLDKVFEMFTQVDRRLEKTTGGLGIGLSLVKGLVEMHGGTIAANSKGEGCGSEFVVQLPILIATPGEDSSSSQQDLEVEPSGLRRILVVDDNVDSADSLGQLLELLGNEVRTAYDGEAGVHAAFEFQPDVVLCDIGMPKVNGYDAARRIRAEPWGSNLVLVALTGWGQDDDRRKTAEAGFDHHLVKPVDTSILIKLLDGLKKATV